MKVKFTKLAALLLAGAALFAVGCNDYEVDIQKVDKKVDDLTSGKVASLESQVAALQATVATLESAADHKADIDKLNKAISDLETALKADYQKKIQDAVNTLTTEINKKVNQADYDVDKAAIQKAITDINTALDDAKNRIKAIEDADFQKQINDLNTALGNRISKLEGLLEGDWNGKTVKQTIDAVAQSVVDLETALRGEINKLDVRVTAAENAIEDIKTNLIPGLEDRIKAIEDELPTIRKNITDLQNGKLDKAEFDTYYKAAYEKYTKATVDEMQNAIKALQALTAGFPEDKTIKEYIDEADQLLKDEFTAKYLTVVAKAFGSETQMNEMQGTLLGRLEACEALLAGDWGDKTVKEYIDAEVKDLQDQIDVINEKIEALDNRVTTLEASMEKVLAALEFCAKEDEDGNIYYDLQGYIDDADQALQDQIDEIWAWIEDYLIPTLNEIFDDIYTQLDDLYDKAYAALQRIQSVQFVPTHDDLKITTNMAYFYQPVDGPEEMAATIIDQPTKITYQFLPSQYAEDVAVGVEDFITDASYYRLLLYLFYGYGSEEDIENNVPFTREELKEIGIGGILPIFNVKPVETRADGEETPIPDPQFIITGVEYDEATVAQTGEITFTVMPVNVASAQFAANGLKPVEGVYMTDNTWDINYRYEDYGLFWDADDMAGADWYNRWVSDYWVHYVYDVDELAAFETRAAFAAQLRLYAYQTSDPIEDYDWDNCDWDAWENDPDYWPDVITVGYIDYENELASPFNVLYPAVTEIELLPDPFKKEDDTIRPFTEDEIWQTLPYSSLREGGKDADGKEVTPNIGEKESQDPKGYRIILDQAVPAVSINGGEPMSIEAARDAGYAIPVIETSFKEFTYEDKDGEELAEDRVKSFKETNKVYAEIEMNPEKSASTRKLEVGDLITGTYEFTSGLGSFSAEGYVTITKPEGEVSVSAAINWVYAQDADTDHAVYYEDADPKYSHVAEPVTIGDDAATLKKTLGIELADFDHKEPKSVTIEPEGLVIENVTIKDGALTADFVDFEWGKTYTVKAVYELDAAEVTVNGTVTTTDRKRDLIEITLDEYAFDLNGDDYDAASDTYTSEPLEFQEDLFKKFTENGIINQGTTKDFEDADDFVGVENNGKEGHLRVVTDAEGNSIYLVIADDNATIVATSAELKEIMGTEQVIYVTTYTGQMVKVIVPVNVNLPAYDFLHLRFYTFNIDKEVANFITKDNFDEANTAVKWWTRVNPSYFVTLADAAATGTVNQERVSNRYALADYDVKYINLAELAFNVVDEKDDIMDEAAIEAANLVVKFDYSVKNQGIKALPTVDQLTNFKKYSDLWVDDTVFYYRTNDKKFIPTTGTLAILSGETEFPLPTRFNTPKNSVKNPDIELDYSTYAVVRWTPFKEAVANDITIVLDENKIYREPLFKGMELKDNRPNGVSFYVIKNGEWVVGNAAADATASSTTNGYITGIKANDAYHITTTFEYSTDALPVELKKLLKIQYSADGINFVDTNADGLTPYITYDYTSEVQFQGVIEIPVTVVLQNPWQEALNFEYSIFIKGYND